MLIIIKTLAKSQAPELFLALELILECNLSLYHRKGTIVIETEDVTGDSTKALNAAKGAAIPVTMETDSCTVEQWEAVNP